MKRKNTIIKLAVVLGSAFTLLLSNCSDTETPVKNDSDFSRVSTFLESIAPPTQTFTRDADQAFVVNTANGLSFNFYPNSFITKTGNAVSGNVDIEITEYMDNKDMITSGVTTSSNNNLLQSGGMFNIAVKQNGEDLRLNNIYTVRIPSLEPDRAMMIFRGEESINANGDRSINWIQQDSSWVDTTKNGYTIDLNFLSWCNLDRFYNASSGAQVRLKLPEDFTSVNTRVFMIFDVNSVVYLFGDAENEEFNSGGYILPLGWDIKLLAISTIDDKLYYSLVNSTIVTNHLETVSSMTEVTEADLETILESL